MSSGGVHKVFKMIFAKTADRLSQCGPEHTSTAARMPQASVHWLRHTAGSYMASNDVDLRHVRDNLDRSLSIRPTPTCIRRTRLATPKLKPRIRLLGGRSAAFGTERRLYPSLLERK